MKPRLLIISFSDISNDARVLKQVRLFASEHSVTTCGLGPRPDPRIDHLPLAVPTSRGASLLRPYANAVLQRLRLFRLLYWRDPLVRQARRMLRWQQFDIVIANDIETVPLSLSIAKPSKVHADLHEYFPGLHDDLPEWVRLRKPYFEWLIRKYATRSASTTTVGFGLAEAYGDNYALDCTVVTNASPYQELVPRAVGSTIRLVHSGVAQPGRQIELTMHAVAQSSNDVSLDLFLMPSDLSYLHQLRTLAAELGDRIRLHEPLSQAELVPELNKYDVGVFVLPPTTFNNANALPNKFFDFVQARLGILIGPSPEMMRILSDYQLGSATDDFTLASLIKAIDGLSPDLVSEWKRRSHAAAVDLSAEQQVAGWEAAVSAIAASPGRA